ncbi:hypothetical protein ACP275_03G023300 [Erythranthe tilingii]
MVFLDEKGMRIHATIKKNLIMKFKELVKEGETYMFQNFLVGDSNLPFRVSTYRFKLNFVGMTVVTNIVAENIPTTNFKFVCFDIIKKNVDEYLLFGTRIFHVT